MNFRDSQTTEKILKNFPKFFKKRSWFFIVFLFSNSEFLEFPNIFGMSIPEIEDFYWFLNKRSKKIAEKDPIFFSGFSVLIPKIGWESQIFGIGIFGIQGEGQTLFPLFFSK